jgi:hypothetical protein
MRHHLPFPVLALAFCFLVTPATMIGASEQTPQTVRWAKGAPGCDSLTEAGLPSKIISRGGIGLRVALQRGGSRYLYALVMVVNASGKDLSLSPQDVALEVITPKRQEVGRLSTDTLAGSIMASAEKSYRESHARASDDANVGSPSVNPHQPGHIDPQVMANRANQRLADTLHPEGKPTPAEQKMLEEAARQASLVRANAWPAGKIANGEKRKGVFYFSAVDFEDAVLRVKLGDVNYEFPFSTREP